MPRLTIGAQILPLGYVIQELKLSRLPIYQEQYEVQTMRPNQPMRSRFGMNKSQAMAYSRREIVMLKQEGYSKVVYQSMMVNLKNLSPITKHATASFGQYFFPFRPNSYAWLLRQYSCQAADHFAFTRSAGKTVTSFFHSTLFWLHGLQPDRTQATQKPLKRSQPF